MTENETETSHTPRWVKVFVVIAAALVVLVAVMLVAGRGGHGPDRHAPGGSGSAGHTGPPPSVTDEVP